MTIGLLDLHDSNLQLWHGDVHVQSPGYALLKDKDYLFGTSARAAARLHPRQVNTRYWWRLGTEALQPALGPARHTGDLVHAHLLKLHEEAGQPGEVLLAVPGSMQREQLALLLGIVQQCPFNAVGMVHRSVALGSLFNPQARLYHLEIQLHQALVTQLAAHDGLLELENSTPLPGCGLLQLQERLVEIIAAEFVRQTRFDPRRKAGTEQQLYDALPATLRALHGSAVTNIDVNGYQARIGAQQLEVAGQRLFDSTAETVGTLRDGDQLIADSLVGLLPGLSSAFSNLQLLRSDDIREALQLQGDSLTQRTEALSFIKALPTLGVRDASLSATGPASPPAPGAQASLPTHLLEGHTARALVAEGMALAKGWSLYCDGAGWQLRGNASAGQADINGRPWRPGLVMATGDAIAIDGGDPVLLIAVTP